VFVREGGGGGVWKRKGGIALWLSKLASQKTRTDKEGGLKKVRKKGGEQQKHPKYSSRRHATGEKTCSMRKKKGNKDAPGQRSEERGEEVKGTLCCPVTGGHPGGGEGSGDAFSGGGRERKSP